MLRIISLFLLTTTEKLMLPGKIPNKQVKFFPFDIHGLKYSQPHCNKFNTENCKYLQISNISKVDAKFKSSFNNYIFIYVVGGCFIGFTYCIYCHKINTHFKNVSGSLRNKNKANYLHVHVFVQLCCKMAWHFSTSIIISVIFR